MKKIAKIIYKLNEIEVSSDRFGEYPPIKFDSTISLPELKRKLDIGGWGNNRTMYFPSKECLQSYLDCYNHILDTNFNIFDLQSKNNFYLIFGIKIKFYD